MADEEGAYSMGLHDKNTKHRNQNTNKARKHKTQRPKHLCFEWFVFCVLFVLCAYLCFGLLRPCDMKKNLIQILPPVFRDDFGGRSIVHNPAFLQKYNAFAKLLNLGHVVRGVKYGDTTLLLNFFQKF